jgi:YbbR domain-containing protein
MSSSNQKRKFKFIPGFIANDFWRKFIALFFAVLIWGRVAARLNEEQKIREIPVKIVLPEEYVLIDNSFPAVDIVLKGSRQHLNRLTPADIGIKHIILNPKVGLNSFVINTNDISIPKGITVKEIIPSPRIKVYIDIKLTKKVPVKLKYTGSLLDGYAYNPAHIVPQEVTVSGPKSIVDKIHYVNTENIILRKENVDDFECLLNVRPVEKNVTITPREISAKIEIYKKYADRTFQNIPIRPFGYTPDGCKLRISPPVTTVTVTGVKKAIETVLPSQIKPCVDISRIDKPGEYTLNLKCWLDNRDITLKDIIPKTVNITITETAQ